MIAIGLQFEEGVKYLLENGANVNIVTNNNISPLKIASVTLNLNINVLKIILQYSQDVE
jgi:hypothetical protein